MKLTKLKPRGNPEKIKATRFAPGQSGNPGGKPFIKIHQKLSVITAEELNTVADEEVCIELGLPAGSTWGRAVAKAMIVKAAGGDVGAANFLNACTESARASQSGPTELTYRITYENSSDVEQMSEELVEANRQLEGEIKQ